MSEEIRCTAPHPRDPTRECHALLVHVAAGSVVVLRANVPAGLLLLGPGCSVFQCERCDALYVLSPRPVAWGQAVG